MTKARSNATAEAAKGDLRVGNGTNLSGILAVGNNGETIVADSSTATGLRWQGDYAAGKNKIINGDFGIWQRGTTFSSINTGDYFADRWVCALRLGGGGHTVAVTRQTFTPGTAPVAGYESPYYLQVQRTVAGDEMYFGQKIEDVRTFAGQTVTFSFWARVTTGTWTMARVFLNQQFGSGGSAEVDNIGVIFPTLTTTWQRFTSTVTVPSITGKTIGTNSNLYLLFQLGNVGNTGTLQFWGAQVEASNTATAFQTATGTIQGELAACQRYYYAHAPAGNASGALGIGSYESGSIAVASVYFPVTMRTAPTLSATSGTSYYTALSFSGGIDVFNSLTIANPTTTNAFIYNSSEISGTGGQACRLLTNTVSSSVAFSAEL